MFFNIKRVIFIVFIFLGSLIRISSSSWFIAWLGLEINLIRLIPLLILKLNYSSTESSIKYFIIQAISSSTIIFLSLIINKIFIFNLLPLKNEILSIILFIKMGIAPFHFWIPQIIDLNEWFQAGIILTWQKIAPLILAQYIPSNIFIITILISSLIGRIGAINQNNLKKIILFSSISHSSWILALIRFNEYAWWNYFLIYSLNLIPLIFIFSFFKIQLINQINFIKRLKIFKFITFINFFSLAGIPPFSGFFIKIISITFLFYNNINYWVIISLIISSLVSLYFYIFIMYSSILLFRGRNYFQRNISISNAQYSLIIHIILLSLLILPIILLA